MNRGNFFTELKRRNVDKVAVAYGVVGWLIVQVGTSKEADRAIELLPASKDAFDGPGLEEVKANVLARLGKKDAAISVLQHLLATPYGTNGPPITPALLRLDAVWDNLRDDPRFQKLCQEPAK